MKVHGYIYIYIYKNESTLQSRFLKEFILKGIKLVMGNINFFFDDKYFLQTKGTVMGTKVPPTYAILVLGYLKEKLIPECKTFLGEECAL